MATDLAVAIEDRPGALAELGEAMGNAGVNIEGLCCVVQGGQAVVHLCVEDSAAAREALQGAGLNVQDEREVLAVPMQDIPGALGDVARKIAEGGANIELVYLATNTRLIVGVDDPERARPAL
jgi:hypothetical protein